MEQIFCFGDSNTWGYDPRSPWEDRYPPSDRWCDLLAAHTGCQVRNLGENGRCIPASPREYELLDRSLPEGPIAMGTLMLGTNDLLMGRSREQILLRLEALLRHLQELLPGTALVLLSPPAIRIPGFDRDSAGLTRDCRTLARDRNLLFLDLQMLPLACDGIHLSPEGHRQLAMLLASLIKTEGIL